jgi:tripartite-type tricarboxylate transporter receptor subunit TctC
MEITPVLRGAGPHWTPSSTWMNRAKDAICVCGMNDSSVEVENEPRADKINREKRLFRIFSVLTAAIGLVTAAPAANAQPYPNRDIHLVIGVAPGGSADVVARLIAQKAGERLGQTIIVENRAGAGGTIGAAVVAKSPADGYTLLFVTASHASNATLYSKLPYDTLKDFAPVSGAVYSPLVVVVNAQSKYKGLEDLIADARARPGKLNYASAAGTGLVALSAHAFREEFKLNCVQINYRGSGPALTALMANEVDFGFDTVAGVVSYVAAGTMRAIAVTTRQRSTVLPDVPTIAEAGAPGFDVLGWFGILAPAGTPKAIIQRLNIEVAHAQVELKGHFKELGVEPLEDSPEQFGSLIESEVARWGGVIKRLGLTAD